MKPHQIPLALPHRAAMAREDFLVAPCNQKAVDLLDSWQSWPSVGLVIYGPQACGKTHLAKVWQSQADALYHTAENLHDSEARYLISQNKAVIIDDLQGLASEEALFHVYNHLFHHKKPLLILSEVPPARMDIKLPDLASRLKSLPVAEVLPPDEEVLSAIFIKHFHDRQVRIEGDVITYLLPRIERSYSAVSRLVEALDQRALVEKRPITLPLVREVLSQGCFS